MNVDNVMHKDNVSIHVATPSPSHSCCCAFIFFSVAFLFLNFGPFFAFIDVERQASLRILPGRAPVPRSIRLASPKAPSNSKLLHGLAKATSGPTDSLSPGSAGVEAAAMQVAASVVEGESLSVLAVGLAPAVCNDLRRLIAEKREVVGHRTVEDAAGVEQAVAMLLKHSVQTQSSLAFDGKFAR